MGLENISEIMHKTLIQHLSLKTYDFDYWTHATILWWWKNSAMKFNTGTHLEIPKGAQDLRLTSSWALGFICFVMSISVLPETKKTYSSKTNSIIPFGTFFKFQSIVHMIEARGIWHACQLPQLHDKVALRFIIQQQPMCNIKVSCWVFQSTLYHMVQL